MNISLLSLLVLLLTPINLFPDTQDIDLSQYRKVEERFFSNGIENRVNSPTYYYDKHDNMVVRLLFNDKGEERFRGIFTWDDDHEMVEYSWWSR